MAKGSALKAALDNFKGIDKKAEHQKKVQKTARKNAEKRKRAKVENEDEDAALDGAIAKAEKNASAPPAAKKSKKNKAQRQAKRAQLAAVAAGAVIDDEAEEASEEEDEEEEEGDISVADKEWETDEEEENTLATNLARLAEDSSDSEDDEEDVTMNNGEQDSEEEDDDEDQELGTDDEEDIALSDLESVASEDKGDIIPHQRLTINNTAALTKAYKSFALSSKLPFSENQTIVSEAPIEIEDVDDDLNRELVFYKQSLDAATRARRLLKKENSTVFSRPSDYFAEMVKSDEHMGKIKQKLIDEAASKKASAEARRQRDLKKFGKQVQVAKLQERSREKRDTMEKINLLKRKRQGAEIGNTNEESMFDVALEDSAETAKKERKERKERNKERSGSGAGSGKPNHKRQKRDEKYGFGGKKRFAKSNDATSAADVSKFSVKKMKGGKKGASRPGKSRRANRA